MPRRFLHSNSLPGVVNCASETKNARHPQHSRGIRVALLEGFMAESPTSLGRRSFSLEYFHRIPRFIRRGLFVFQGTLEVHFCQGIFRVKFQEAREQDFRLSEIAIPEFANSFLVRFQPG